MIAVRGLWKIFGYSGLLSQENLNPLNFTTSVIPPGSDKSKMSAPSQNSACLILEDGLPCRIVPPESRKPIMLFHPEVCDVEAVFFVELGSLEQSVRNLL